jgi:hypothetical protein
MSKWLLPKLKKALALTVLVCFGLVSSAHGGTKMVMIHYMPWFMSQPYSGTWGWHWTMNHYNPNTINATNGEQEIASWYYPLIGPYDSLDPAVLEYHVLLMKLAGADGMFVDWDGPDNFDDYAVNNQRTVAMLGYARKASLAFSVVYEDYTIGTMISGGYLAASNATSHAQGEMLYLQTNFFNDPTFLRWNGAPVLLNFGPQYFMNSTNWTSIFSVLSRSNQPAFFTENNRLSIGEGAFDWPPMSLSVTNAQSPTEPVLSDSVMNNYLASFDRGGAGWPAYISAAFPRFHDIYAQAGVEPSFGYLDDQNGSTFTETLSRAMTNSSTYIQVVTWNDFGEGTIIEPTVEYGYRDLGVLQNFRRQYLAPNFAFTTNDLTLPLRLYNLRKSYGTTNAIVSAELDRIFTNIVSSNLTAANLQLTGVESNVPVIYNVSATNGQLEFCIGGYLSAAGLRVLTSSSLEPGGWQLAATFAAGTNGLVFNDTLPAQGGATFFKVQNAGP